MSEGCNEEDNLVLDESGHELAMRLFVDNRFQQVFDVLRRSSEDHIDVTSMVDKKGCTLLHYSVLSFDIDHVKFLIDYVQAAAAAAAEAGVPHDENSSEISSSDNFSDHSHGVTADASSSPTRTAISPTRASHQRRMSFPEWLNWPTHDGFTAILYASFRGDCKMISLLVRLGANIHARNSKGLNALHVAAQGDQPLSLRYFQKLGLSPMELEYKHSNPLHWASFLGNEHAINYLTAYTEIDLASRDEVSPALPLSTNQTSQQGYSPLFLAVMSGSARAVKRLLQKGASKNQRDLNGNTPIQQAKELGYESIRQMLEEEGGVQEYFNLRQPFKPLEKSLKQVGLFFLLLCVVQGCFGAFYVPCLERVELFVLAGLTSFMLLMYLFSWLVDAGTVSDVKGDEANVIRDQLRRRQKTASAVVNDERMQITATQIMKKTEYNNPQESMFTQDQHVSIINANLVARGCGGISGLNVNQYQRAAAAAASAEVNDVVSPGKVEEIEHDELVRLYSSGNQNEEICVECQIVKPRRSKHCEVCKKCVRVYDHHCPWINNCVGCGNLKYFIGFLLGLWLVMADLVAMVVMHFEGHYSSSNFVHWFTENDEWYARNMKFAAGVVIGVIVIPFWGMLTALLFVQLKNVFLNKTTYERFSARVNSSTLSGKSPHSSQLKSEMSSELLSKLGEDTNRVRRKSSQTGGGAKQTDCKCFNVIRMCCANQHDATFNYNKI